MMGIIIRKVSFNDVFEEWLSFRKGDLKESSRVKYRNIVKNYLLESFGEKDIRTLSNKKIKKYFEELKISGGKKRIGLSAATMRTIVTVIKSIFRYAADNKRLKVANLSDLKVEHTKKELRVLSTEEQIKLEEECGNNLTYKAVGILLMLFTGIRVGELCALKWEDINLENCVMVITRTLQRLQIEDSTQKTKLVETAPKSQHSIRQVPIPSYLKTILEKVKGQTGDYLLSGNSKAVEPRSMQRYIMKITKKLSIENVTCHTLRHSFATRCVEYRVDVKSLSEILGHSSVQITMDRYVHPSMEMKKKSLDRLIEAMHRDKKVS